MSAHGFSVRGSPAVRGPRSDYLGSVRVRCRKRVCASDCAARRRCNRIRGRTFGLAAGPSVGDKRHADLCRWCGDVLLRRACGLRLSHCRSGQRDQHQHCHAKNFLHALTCYSFSSIGIVSISTSQSSSCSDGSNVMAWLGSVRHIRISPPLSFDRTAASRLPLTPISMSSCGYST